MLILINDIFISNKKEIAKTTKIILKICKYFIFVQSIKFYKT